jgi:hypothetical protein
VAFGARDARFFLGQRTKTGKKYQINRNYKNGRKIPIPNEHKLGIKIAIKFTSIMYTFQGPKKYTKWDFWYANNIPSGNPVWWRDEFFTCLLQRCKNVATEQKECSNRVTRLGEFSPNWATVFFGQLLENNRSNS